MFVGRKEHLQTTFNYNLSFPPLISRFVVERFIPSDLKKWINIIFTIWLFLEIWC